MGILVRYNAFETNSSSSHSLVMFGSETYSAMPQKAYPGEYGWGWVLLTTAQKKLDYIVTEMLMSDNIFTGIVNDMIDDYDIVIDGQGDFHIDHQSIGTMSNSAFGSSVDALVEFITNDAYKIVIGNDNSDMPAKLLTNDLSIYKYLLTINGAVFPLFDIDIVLILNCFVEAFDYPTYVPYSSLNQKMIDTMVIGEKFVVLDSNNNPVTFTITENPEYSGVEVNWLDAEWL